MESIRIDGCSSLHFSTLIWRIFADFSACSLVGGWRDTFASACGIFRYLQSNTMKYVEAKLLVLNNSEGSKHVFILDERGLLVGSGRECDICVSGEAIDTQHARLIPKGDLLWVRTSKGPDGNIDSDNIGRRPGDLAVREPRHDIGDHTFFRCTS